ncbi:hypothetical protein [Pseudomarimonas salicorniae]|uniref:Uncharacterized protein n=1 Tax=Pseudomarimonas salicorniae TaxID=2933270 RepID=A0ABT0GJD0_9GAMM|nr:hypothetical protein [Lysobacter sp. CAU 1642]MCK7594452.1 hypothetical protein [Lysobacter sp. CAU 1642]
MNARAVLVAGLLATSSSACAELVSVDWLEVGDGLITRDTRTGLDWLDLTPSLGLTFVELAPRLAPGGSLEEFRLASAEELRSLYKSALIPAQFFGYPHGYYGHLPPSDAPRKLTALIHPLSSTGNGASGIYALPYEPGPAHHTSYFFGGETHTLVVIGMSIMSPTFRNDSDSHPGAGAFLVKSAAFFFGSGFETAIGPAP